MSSGPWTMFEQSIPQANSLEPLTKIGVLGQENNLARSHR